MKHGLVKILDRYILQQYLVTFVFVVLILISIICVIDYTEKSDDFIKNDVPFDKILFDYYANFIPFMANTLSPISVFITTVFVTSRLASRTEIVAILTSGVSFKRFLLPYFIGSCFLGICIFYLVGWVTPDAAKTKVAFEVKYTKSPYFFDGRNVHFRCSDSTYAYIESYNNALNIGYKFTLEKIKDRQLLEKLTTDYIQWDTVKNIWHIESYQVHVFKDSSERMLRGNSIDTVLNLYPKDFQSNYAIEETMTVDELDQIIAEYKLRGTDNAELFLSEKYTRYAYPFAIVILTMMGVIVSARKSRRGTGFQIALGFLLAFVYILFVVMSRSVGRAGSLDPLLSAFLPNIIFMCVAVVLYYTVPR